MPKLGMRTRIILLFIIVSIGGLVLLNNVFQSKHEIIHNSLGKMELSSRLRELKLHSREDSLKAESLMKDFNSTKAVLITSLGSTLLDGRAHGGPLTCR